MPVLDGVQQQPSGQSGGQTLNLRNHRRAEADAFQWFSRGDGTVLDGVTRCDGEAVRGLILSDNIIIGHQIASLLHAYDGWRMRVEYRDKQAYAMILRGDVDVVIADIDAEGLGGLAVLACAIQHRPSITTYGISQSRDSYLQGLARDMGGCRDFFYMAEGRLKIDTCAGIAAQLLCRLSPSREGLAAV